MGGEIEKVFVDILNMSLTGCVAVLAVILARLLLRRAPRIFSYALWAVVLFRLLCPVSFVSEVSLLGFLQSEPAQEGRMAYIPPDIGVMEEPEVTLPVKPLEDGVNASLPRATAGDSANPMQIVLYVTARIWLIGMVGMLGYSVCSLLLLRKKLENAVWERENIYRLPGAGTPFVCGLIRPRIYYPHGLDGEEKDYILVHEQIHIRRGDHIMRMIAYLALCVHWFNPLVWIAYVLSGRDMEMSCDEAVLRKMGSGVKKEYSASLLALATGRMYGRGIPLAFGEKDTGGRIKNVLRYKKPKAYTAGAVAMLCAVVALFLLANPADVLSITGEPTVFYGIVEPIDFDGSKGLVLWIPGIGEVEEPQVKNIIDSDPETFSGLQIGWLVRITFPAGEEVAIQETWPARFSIAAESIEMIGEGFAGQNIEGGRCQMAIPMDFSMTGADGTVIPEPIPGDVLVFSDADGGQLATAQSGFVDFEAGQIWMELSLDGARMLLDAYEGGYQCEVIREDGFGSDVETEGDKDDRLAENGGQQADDDGILPLGPDRVVDGRVMDGTYRVYVRSISRSLRGIDLFVAEGWEEDAELPTLVFDDGCIFWVNVEMDNVRYEERDFDEFADLVSDAYSYLNPPLRLVLKDGLIEEAYLDSAYYGAGIAYAPVRPAIWSLPDIEQITGQSMDEILAEYYVPADTVEADISDAEGMEMIEVYTGNIGDGDSGIVLIRSQSGTILYGDGAHVSRAGWNNIYLGERDGVPFLMTMHIEDRDTYGEYGYYVFRLGEGGEVRQIAGSTFTFGSGNSYDDNLFREWAERLYGYLEDSHLLLSSQEMELRTVPVSEADRYNYDTLRRTM